MIQQRTDRAFRRSRLRMPRHSSEHVLRVKPSIAWRQTWQKRENSSSRSGGRFASATGFRGELLPLSRRWIKSRMKRFPSSLAALRDGAISKRAGAPAHPELPLRALPAPKAHKVLDRALVVSAHRCALHHRKETVERTEIVNAAG